MHSIYYIFCECICFIIMFQSLHILPFLMICWTTGIASASVVTTNWVYVPLFFSFQKKLHLYLIKKACIYTGIDAARLASYDRPIRSPPPKFSEQQVAGLAADLACYRRTLAAVHSGADLASAVDGVLGYDAGECKGLSGPTDAEMLAIFWT